MDRINYLNMRGDVKHAYNIHCYRMKERGLPHVSYQAFCYRLKAFNGDVYKAIYTPPVSKKIPMRYRKFDVIEKPTLRERFKDFINKHVLRRG